MADALALATAEADAWTEYGEDVAAAEAGGEGADAVRPPPRNPALLGFTPCGYVLHTLCSLRPSDVDQVLLVLPAADAVRLLKFLVHALTAGTDGAAGLEVACRGVLLLLRVHGRTFSAASGLRPLLSVLRDAMHARVAAHRDRVGFNVAGLRLVAGGLGVEGPGLGGGVLPTAKPVRVGKRRDVVLF